MDYTIGYEKGSEVKLIVNSCHNVHISTPGGADKFSINMPCNETINKKIAGCLVVINDEVIRVKKGCNSAFSDNLNLMFDDSADCEIIRKDVRANQSTKFTSVDKVKFTFGENNSIVVSNSSQDGAMTSSRDRDDTHLLEKIKEYIADINKDITGFSDEIINNINEARELTAKKNKLETRLNDNIAEVDKLKRDVATAEQELKDLSARNESLKSQLELITNQKALMQSDVNKQSSDLEELRDRIDMDSETVALWAQIGEIKNGTFAKAIEAIEKDINALEDKMSIFLRIRTKIADAINHSILSSDGAINESLPGLSNEPSGGGANGN